MDSIFLTDLMKKEDIEVVSFSVIKNYQIVDSDIICADKNFLSKKQFLFQGCSLSKSITALAIINLINQYNLNLDSNESKID